MKIREYIISKLPSFQLTDADFVDIPISVDDEYDSESNGELVGKAMIALVEELVYRPHMKSINESGFSANWEYDLGKYYMYLCRKYDVKPNVEVGSMLGVSTIKIMDLADFF